MATFFVFLYNLLVKHKTLLWLVLAALMVTAGILISKIKFEEDIGKVLPLGEAGTDYNQALNASGLTDRMVLYLSVQEAAQKPELIEAADSLYAQIQTHLIPRYLTSVVGKTSEQDFGSAYDFIYDHLPFFLTDADYKVIEQRLQPDAINSAVESGFKTLMTPSGSLAKDYVLKDPLGFVPVVLERLKSGQLDDNLQIKDGYFFSSNGSSILMFLLSGHGQNESAYNNRLVTNLDKIIEGVENKHGKVKIGYYGSIPVAVGNSKVIKQDIILTVSLALLLLLILLTLYYGQVSIILKIFAPAALGAALALSVLYLIYGSFSIIILGIGALLLGIAVDYALHVITHFKHSGNVQRLLKETSTPIIISAITTASAFLCLRYMRSEALKELGVLAALCIVFSAIITLVVLPQLLNKKQKIEKGNPLFVEYLAALPFEKNKWLGVLIPLLSVLFLFTANRVKFSTDLTNMSYESSRLQRMKAQVDEISSVTQKSAYINITDTSFENLMLKAERLNTRLDSMKNMGLITGHTSLNTFIRSKSAQIDQLDTWNRFWGSGKSKRVASSVTKASQKLGFKETAFSRFDSLIHKTSFQLMDNQTLETLPFPGFENLITKNQQGYSTMIPVKLKQENKPRFFSALESDKDFTILDKSLITTRLLEFLKRDFNRLVWISLAVVFGILLLAFGRIELALIAFAPMVLSWLWTVGIMGLFGIPFNMFNIIISTFVFGLGIDYAIMLLKGLQNEHKYGIRNTPTFKASIILSMLTTLLGIGVLIFARHPALKSIALMAIIAICTVVFITFTILPRLFRWLTHTSDGQREYPMTLSNLAFSLFAFLFFLTACILLSILIPVLAIVPAKLSTKKLFFHKCLMYLMRGVKNSVFTIKKKVHNPYNETFEKPAVIIANHQSHLDLIMLLSLHPKLIVLTNNWVWNNIFYGFVVRYADFYTVTDGFDKILPDLQKRVDEGYSIVVFPEGTRSPNREIKRFKKGAFELAEQLNIDILPIVIQGAGDCLPKHEFLLKSGSIGVHILKRIPIMDPQFGTDRRARAKAFAGFMRKKYVEIKRREENPAYFAPIVAKNYLYKGPVLEWYIKSKLRLAQNFKYLNSIIPRNAIVTDIGCGYGYMDFMLYLLSPKRQIRGLDFDKEKIAIAKRCFLAKDITFQQAEATHYKYENADVFILNDSLHYLPYQDQEKLISTLVQNLNPDGQIIIHDANASDEFHNNTKFTEFLSTKFGFNQTAGDTKQLYFFSDSDVARMAAGHNLKFSGYKSSKRTSNQYYILSKRS